MRTVLVTGGFDPLHSGHIAYFKAARELGDKLVVALNTDESIQSQNKDHALINSLEDRKAAIGALDFVDFVVEFNEETPYDIIKAIQPDVLIKGSEYSNPVGSDIVSKVVLAPMLEGYSTTEVIRKIKDS